MSIAVAIFAALLWWQLWLPRRLLRKALERQPGHELEHLTNEELDPGVHFTDALRVENIANRYIRRMRTYGLRVTKDKARRLARRALCLSRT